MNVIWLGYSLVGQVMALVSNFLGIRSFVLRNWRENLTLIFEIVQTIGLIVLFVLTICKVI